MRELLEQQDRGGIEFERPDDRVQRAECGVAPSVEHVAERCAVEVRSSRELLVSQVRNDPRAFDLAAVDAPAVRSNLSRIAALPSRALRTVLQTERELGLAHAEGAAVGRGSIALGAGGAHEKAASNDTGAALSIDSQFRGGGAAPACWVQTRVPVRWGGGNPPPMFSRSRARHPRSNSSTDPLDQLTA